MVVLYFKLSHKVAEFMTLKLKRTVKSVVLPWGLIASGVGSWGLFIGVSHVMISLAGSTSQPLSQPNIKRRLNSIFRQKSRHLHSK